MSATTKRELTEKSDVEIPSNNDNKNNHNHNNIQMDTDLAHEVNEIYKHIENGTITKPIFESFWNKINHQIISYKQTIETYKKSSSHKPIPTEPIFPEVDVEKLVSETKLVGAFDNIQGRTPKCRLHIEFYPQFFTFISQKKFDQHKLKTLIYYSDIQRLICIPEKNTDILLYFQLKPMKIPLKWRKQSIVSFTVTFEDLSGYEDCIEDMELCNLNTTLPAKLTGTEETRFCRIISELSEKRIDRHDKTIFQCNDSNSNRGKSNVYFEGIIGSNKCEIYPLRAGIFLTPKPLRFIPQTRIKYYEFAREGDGLRYFDMDIILYPEEEQEDASQNDISSDATNNNDNNNNKEVTKKKKRSKELEISLSMISKSDRPAIESYFASLGIKCKREGKPSPDRRRKNKQKTDNDKSEKSDDDEDEEVDINEMEEDEVSDSDDEEYCVEDDHDEDEYGNDDYSDSASDATVHEEELTQDEEEEDDDDEDDDLDMEELKDVMKNVELVENGQKLYTKQDHEDDDEEKKDESTDGEKKQQILPQKMRKIQRKKKKEKELVLPTSPKSRKSKKPKKKQTLSGDKGQKKKRNRKRSRAQMESESKKLKKLNLQNKQNPIEINSDSEDDQHSNTNSALTRPIKRQKWGRKTTNYGENGSNIVSKSIPKKRKQSQSPSKSISVEIVGSSSPKKKKKKAKKHSLSPSKRDSPKKKNKAKKRKNSNGSNKENKPKKIKSKTKAKKQSKIKNIGQISLIEDDNEEKDGDDVIMEEPKKNQRRINEMFKAAS